MVLIDKMERILAVCEFHGECEKVIQKVLEIGSEGDFVYILYFIPSKMHETIDKKAHTMIKGEAKKVLQTCIEKIRKEKISCKGKIKRGNAFSAMKKIVNKYKSTLIIIGYDKKGLFSHYSMEELMQKIADMASIPVMVVK